jgi:hypothetical protein
MHANALAIDSAEYDSQRTDLVINQVKAMGAVIRNLCDERLDS